LLHSKEEKAQMINLSIDTFEGRLVAQRKLLGLLVAEFSRQGGNDRLWEFLRERQTPQDNQEDPGAVPSEGLEFALAMADEFRLIEEVARREQENNER
jgi:hypothetical protein